MDDISKQSATAEFLSSRDAAAMYGLTHDHVARLCRQGKIQGVLQGGNWLVEKKSLTDFFAKANRKPREIAVARVVPASTGHFVTAPPVTIKAPALLANLPNQQPQEFSKTVAAFALAALLFVGTTQIVPREANVAAASFGSLPSFFSSIASVVKDLFSDTQTPLIAKETTTLPVPPAQQVSTSTSAVVKATPSQTIIEQNTYPVIERTLEREIVVSGVTEELLSARLTELSDRFGRMISGSSYPAPPTSYAGGGLTNMIALSNKIDNLDNLSTLSVTSELTFDGVTGSAWDDFCTSITGSASLCDGSDASGGGGTSVWATSTDDLLAYPVDTTDVVVIGASATTTAGNILEVNGSSLFRNALTAYGTLTAPIFAATSTTAASTFPYASSTALTVSGTAYFETASSTNLLVNTATTTNLTIGSLTNSLLTTNSLGQVVASSTLSTAFGGTGISSYSAGDLLYANTNGTLSKLGIGSVGQVLKVSGGLPSWGTDLSGGSGGAGAWATSTDDLFIYPADTTDVVVIGASATSTTGNILEVKGTSLFRDLLTAYGTITAPIFTATSTTAASTFPYASTTALTISGTGYLTGLTNALLSTNSAGQVVGTTSVSVGYLTGILPIANGGTNASSFATTNNSLYYDGTRLVTSGTSQAVTTPYASSTALTSTSVYSTTASTTNLTISGIQNSLLYTSAAGVATAATVSSPLSFSAGTLSIQNAAADGSTKGAASFTATDFDAASGVISIDYTNGQAASASTKGFLTSSDWSLFNNKVSTSSIDTLAELETLTGVSNILIENDIDASSELAALMDDETGSGALVFGTSPTLSGVTLSGDTTLTNASTTLLTVSGQSWFGGNLNLTGSAANIVLGSNYLSGDGGDEGIFVDSSGNVALGTSTSNARLTVRSTGSTATAANQGTAQFGVGSGASNVGVELGASTVSGTNYPMIQGFTFATGAAQPLTVNPFGGNTLLNPTSGSVGVGTTSPSEKLSVQSSDNSSATNILAVRSANSTQGIGVGYNTIRQLGAGNLTLDTASQLIFTVGGTETARINSSGSVGIGHTSPSEKLNVQGTVAAQVFTATSTTAASTFPYASSTALSVSGTGYFDTASTTNLTISGIQSSLLYTSAAGVATAATVSSPLSFSAGTLSIQDAAADGSTKGAASFTATDFDAASGVISIDYTNGQAASASTKGFLTSSDWSIFNNKVSTSSIDTLAELETLWGSINVLTETEIDASSELAALLDDETGTGNLVFSASPTLTGTAIFANASSTLFSNTGTAYFGGSATSSFSSAGVLTLATPLAASSGGTGLNSLGTGVATWLGTPSSANLASALTDETGSGSAVFSASPTFTGTASFADTTNSGTLSVTGLTTLASASTTRFSVLTAVAFGSSATSTFDSAGNLSVAGTLSVTGNTTLVNASTTLVTNSGQSWFGGNLNLTGTAANIVLGSNFLSGDGGDEGVFVDSNGNVGIGTSTPQAMFVVGGTTGSTLSVSSAGVITDGTWQGDVISSTYLDTAVIVSTEIDTLAELETIMSSINILAETEIDASSELAALMDDETGSGALVFATSPTLSGVTLSGNTTLTNASTTLLTVSGQSWFGGNINLTGSSANIVLGSNWLSGDGGDEGLFVGASGNVGIGTSSPFAKFAVHANSGETNLTLFEIASSTASATTSLFSVSNTGLTTVGDSSGTGDASVQFAADSNAWTMGYYSSDKSFRIASSTELGSNILFQIGKNGRVGIGTTTPYAKLAVHANSGETNRTLFEIASSTASATTSLFSVSNTGLTTVGDSSGTGSANFQFASDSNAWTMGYYSVDKTFRIASSTNLASNAMFQIGKSGTTTLNSGLGTGTGGNYLCIDTSTFEVLRGNGSSCTASSERFKDNIVDLEYGLSEVLQLRPVSFTYKPEMNSGTSTHLGFIAEEVEAWIPELVTYNNNGQIQGLDYPTVTAVLTKAIQELNLNLETLASTTASSTPQSKSFAESFLKSIFARITSWLADATNGITTVFAKSFKAQEEICVDDQCLTKDDVRALIEMARNPSSSGQTAGAGGTSGSGSTSEPDTEKPVISVQGANPAHIDIGAAYSDLGATVTDNKDENLGIKVTVHSPGSEDRDFNTPGEVTIDTSVAGEHTITYRATDQAGNVGEATRTVVVGSSAPAEEPAEESAEEPAAEPAAEEVLSEPAAEEPQAEETPTP